MLKNFNRESVRRTAKLVLYLIVNDGSVENQECQIEEMRNNYGIIIDVKNKTVRYENE